MYSFYSIFWKKRGVPVMSIHSYMQKKRRGESDADMLRGIVPEKLLKTYIVWKRRPIESREALDTDTLIPGMQKALHMLFQAHVIIVVSARQSRKKLEHQLESVGVARYVREMYAVGFIDPVSNKQKVMEGYLDRHKLNARDAYVVGDTEMEIEAAKRAKIPCISVTWGVRSERFLRDHGAKEIVRTPQRLLVIR